MIISPSRAPDPPAKRLAATLYGYAFFDEFVLLYPVYALLFTDTGLSISEISSLFIIWSATGIVLEVPSGVWADAVSRRVLLAAGPLVGGAGFALWVLIPSYWAFAAGFVLWGIRGALQSGALEALVYEELDRLGAAERYARTMGRARTVGLVAVVTAMAAAGPVFAAGGYGPVGLVSVLACLGTAAVGMAFPEHRSRQRLDEGEEAPGYAATLRAGLAEARTDRRVRAALLLVPAVTAIWGALDEYVPLLARDIPVSPGAVPLLVLLVWAGVTIGGLLAGVGQRMTARTSAAALAFAALALVAGAISGIPAGFVLVAAAFAVFQMASVVADARLQEKITGPSRATVTSLAGLGTELATVVVYGAYAAASAMTSHGITFALFAVPYLVIALRVALGGGRTPTTTTDALTDATTAP
jgi:MFS family permease